MDTFSKSPKCDKIIFTNYKIILINDKIEKLKLTPFYSILYDKNSIFIDKLIGSGYYH